MEALNRKRRGITLFRSERQQRPAVGLNHVRAVGNAGSLRFQASLGDGPRLVEKLSPILRRSSADLPRLARRKIMSGQRLVRDVLPHELEIDSHFARTRDGE